MKVLLDSLQPNHAEGEKTDRIKIVVDDNAFLIEEYEGGIKVTKVARDSASMIVEPAYSNQIKIK